MNGYSAPFQHRTRTFHADPNCPRLRGTADPVKRDETMIDCPTCGITGWVARAMEKRLPIRVDWR